MITSVIGQMDRNDQLVIVDAGSTDSTPDILNAYSAHITHVEVAPLKQAPAIRWGFDHFTSDLCCYLNTDDILMPGAIERIKNHFAKHPQCDAVYSHRAFIDGQSRVSRIWHLPEHRTALMGRWDYIPQETCFWRRSAMDVAGGIDASFDFAMDYDFFCRLMRNGRLERLNEFLACFREHEESKTNNLVTTIGAEEVDRVRAKYGFTTSGLWRGIGRLLRHYIELKSRLALTANLQAELQVDVNIAIRKAGHSSPADETIGEPKF